MGISTPSSRWPPRARTGRRPTSSPMATSSPWAASASGARRFFFSRAWSARKGANDEGAERAGAIHDEDKGHCSAGAQVLRMDRRLDLVLPQHLPADVGLEGGVQRVWPMHRAPQVLLMTVGAD